MKSPSAPPRILPVAVVPALAVMESPPAPPSTVPAGTELPLMTMITPAQAVDAIAHGKSAAARCSRGRQYQ